MTPYTFSVTIFASCTLILGLMVWLKRKDPVGRSYLIYSLFVAGWGYGYSWMISSNISYAKALILARASNLSAAWIAVTWYWFVLIFCGSRSKLNFFILYLGITVASCVSATAFSPLFIPSVHTSGPFLHYPSPGPSYYFFTALFAIWIFAAFYELGKKWRTSHGPFRTQIKGLFISAFIGFAAGTTTFLPVYDIPFPQYALFFIPVYPFLLAYFITQEKLFDKEKLADAAHRSKLEAMGLIMASLGHELKSPLSSIFTEASNHRFLYENRKFADAEAAHQAGLAALESIQRQVERANNTIHRLVGFVKKRRYGGGGAQVTTLADVWENIRPLIHFELYSNTIELETRMPPEISFTAQDPGCAEEIIFNLVINSAQALKRVDLESQKRKITLSGRQENGAISIEVEDNGPGIPSETLAHIFEPFYTTKEEGLGLGLYITQELAKKMRGKINASSEPGRGARFTLTFPK